MNSILICPMCACELCDEGKSLICSGKRRHCFDKAASGYVNLCPDRRAGGDPKEAVRSRTDFLSRGYYKPISNAVCRIIKEEKPECRNIVDAGCGEGYYSNNIARETGANVYGFDLSKWAVDAASRSAKREGLAGSSFFVGGIYDMPVKDGSADVITNIFAPCAEEEFLRVLADGGVLVVVASGENHLMGLKKAIYDEVYPNEESADLPKCMTEVKKLRLTYEISLNSSDDIRNLFSMTPYSYRTSAKDHEKLLSLTQIKTEIDVEISVYRKDTKR